MNLVHSYVIQFLPDFFSDKEFNLVSKHSISREEGKAIYLGNTEYFIQLRRMQFKYKTFKFAIKNRNSTYRKTI